MGAGSPAGGQDLDQGAEAGNIIPLLRAAMRRLVSGVAVITTCDGNEPHGMTATSVSSLSFEPPSMLVCVNRSASMHDILEASGTFCINLLARDQEVIGQRFARKPDGPSRFDEVAWTMVRDLPRLAGVQASIFCTQAAHLSFGTHTIFVGAVNGVEVSGEVNPLTYVDGRFLP